MTRFRPKLGTELAGAFLALGGFAVFALHDALIKTLGAAYGAPQLVFFSALAGVLPTLILARRMGGLRLAPGRDRALLRLRSALVITSMLGAFHAFSTLPLAQTYAILFSAPLLIALLAVPLLNERLGPVRLAAIVIGLAGVLIVLQPGREALQPGHLSAGLSAICAAFVSVLTRKIAGRVPMGLILIQPMIGTLLVTGLVLPMQFRPVPLHDGLLMLLLGSCAALAMAMTIRAFQLAPASIVAPLQYSQAVWALFYGAVLFNEVPGPATLIGAGVVIASGVFVLLNEARARPPLPGLTPPG